jgi:hypothetical protein
MIEEMSDNFNNYNFTGQHRQCIHHILKLKKQYDMKFISEFEINF